MFLPISDRKILRMTFEHSPFRQVWLESPDGRILSALINGELGWLMYLRESGDAGFSSRNPEYVGSAAEMVQYQLDNGQIDEYPRAWAYPVEVIDRAIEYFSRTGKPPTFIEWHNDSGDGRPIIPKEPHYPGRSGRVFE